MAEITSVTSEALQAKIRELLPSQQGFGEDLQASNVITPIIDLTQTAEGSGVRQDLQSAINFGGATEFIAAGATTVLTSTPGFYRVNGVSVAANAGTICNFEMTDGATTKIVWRHRQPAGVAGQSGILIDLTFFVATGITLQARSGSAAGSINGSFRQIADVNGVLVNPTGFTPQ